MNPNENESAGPSAPSIADIAEIATAKARSSLVYTTFSNLIQAITQKTASEPPREERDISFYITRFRECLHEQPNMFRSLSETFSGDSQAIAIRPEWEGTLDRVQAALTAKSPTVLDRESILDLMSSVQGLSDVANSRQRDVLQMIDYLTDLLKLQNSTKPEDQDYHSEMARRHKLSVDISIASTQESRTTMIGVAVIVAVTALGALALQSRPT